MTSALIREGERDLRQAEQEKTQRADHMKVELNIGVMCHKQECLKPPEAARDNNHFPFVSSEGTQPVDTLILDSWPPEL